MRRIGVLDYGSGNLNSAVRALENTGAPVILSSDTAELRKCDALVLPGVGAFAACMDQIVNVGGDDLVREFVATQKPLLGICVGHQVLFSEGEENGQKSAGIGIYPGRVEKLTNPILPHMGWNQLSDGNWYYFVHSYAARNQSDIPADAEALWAEYGDEKFIAAVKWKNVTSTQFHPEKSAEAGAKLLRNWVVN